MGQGDCRWLQFGDVLDSGGTLNFDLPKFRAKADAYYSAQHVYIG